MTKFALIKDFSFNFKNEFVSLENSKIFKSLEGKVEFIEFSSTIDFITKVTSIMGNCILEVLNCNYDKNTLIQAFYLENDSSVHEKLIMVKRLIMENDTYTYTEFNPSDPNTDKFKYLDMTIDDVVNIVRSKYVHNGIIVNTVGNVQSVEYIDTYDDTTDSGTLCVSKNGSDIYTIKYLNLKNIMQKSNENKEKLNEEQFAHLIEQKLDSTEATYIYSQTDASIALVNCYYETVALNKNNVISAILGSDIYGDVLIGLENHLNDDNRILSLTPELFSKLTEMLKTKNTKIKNKHFYNIYYELDV